MNTVPMHIGRSLLALYFILPGVMKFAAWETHISLMETHEMPMVPVLLALAGVIQIGAGLCLLANKQVALCSLALAGMVLIINFNLHDFWNTYEGVDPERETQNFMKNLGIFAGLLVLASADLTKSKKVVSS